MKKVGGIGLLVAAMVIVPLAFVFAQGGGPTVVPPPSGSGTHQSIELKDYYSQTPDCQLFYSKTMQLRKDYMVTKFDCNEELREKGQSAKEKELVMACMAIADKIDKEQPARFKCPW